MHAQSHATGGLCSARSKPAPGLADGHFNHAIGPVRISAECHVVVNTRQSGTYLAWIVRRANGAHVTVARGTGLGATD